MDESGRHRAADLLPSMYEDLRQLAIRKLANEMPGQTLNATALVHEAYLRVTREPDDSRWDTKGHFYIAAAEAMRRILIDRARRRKAVKHGGDLKREPLDSIVAPAAPDRSEQLLALDDALKRLAAEDERKAQVVKLRYFVGLSVEEVAEILEASTATVKRDWAFARAWLHHEIAES